MGAIMVQRIWTANGGLSYGRVLGGDHGTTYLDCQLSQGPNHLPCVIQATNQVEPLTS